VAAWGNENFPFKFDLSDNFIFVRKLLTKSAKFEAENTPLWGNLGGKLKFWHP